MVTHPEFRQQGYGSHLLRETRLALASKTCFCFAEEHNAAFYLANNFLSETIEQLPAEFHDRLKAYQQKRPTLQAYRYCNS
jgi:ribosomal protein S18 acetylase RimI-like enzyme